MRRLRREERPVGPRPAGQQAAQRVVGLAQEGRRRAGRRLGAGRVAVAPGVLDRDPARLAADPDGDRAARGGQRLQPLAGGRRAAARPGGDLLRREVAEAPQQVGDLVHGARPALVDQRLALQLRLLEGGRVQQLAELLLAEQLAEEVAIERQRLRAPLGERGVALVHEGGDVVEEERRGERRGPRGLDAVDGDLAPLHAAQHVAQGRQVEDVGQALAIGLDEDREAAVAGGDREQVAARWRCCQSGVRVPGRRRGRSRARAAFSRKRDAKSAVPPTAATTRSSTPSASGKSSSSTPSRSPSGRRMAMPSSDQMLAPRRRAARGGAPRSPSPTERGPAAERREQDEPPVAELVPERWMTIPRRWGARGRFTPSSR